MSFLKLLAPVLLLLTAVAFAAPGPREIDKYAAPYKYPEGKCYWKVQNCCVVWDECVKTADGYKDGKTAYRWEEKDGEDGNDGYSYGGGGHGGYTGKKHPKNPKLCEHYRCSPLESKYPDGYERPEKESFVNYAAEEIISRVYLNEVEYDEYERGHDDYQNGYDKSEKGPDGVEMGPDEAEKGPDEVENGPDEVEIGPDEFEKGPDEAEIGLDEVEEGPDEVEKGPDEVEKESEDS
mmetsp:Transcript_401/g.1175  ORF Transcript_401/g.1175 Transcript_401/m.1175 type:complete len:236 (-) Transcript_401:75-782(-)